MNEDIDLGKFFELATTNETYNNRLNLHETENETLVDFTGDLERIGSTLIGEVEQKTYIRLKIMDFETYFIGIDFDYDSEDVTFARWLYILYRPEPNKVNRSQYGRGLDSKQDIVENIGNSCYIPTSGNCFIKFSNYLTGKDYMRRILTFIRTEQR